MRMTLAGLVAHMGEIRNEHKILVKNPKWKRRLGKPRLNQEDNIKIDLRNRM
jgi:hypothetical protein